MRRWLAAPLVFAAAIALALSPQAPRTFAQDAKVAVEEPSEETFLTADGVQLRGLFHRSMKNPNSDPVVIMMYPPGVGNNMDKGDWKGLASRFQEKGYNVFRFDWRGHGSNAKRENSDIKDVKKFWENPYTGPWNQALITGAPKGATKKVKNDFNFKDVRRPDLYMPVLLLDLAAVRYHLDSKNDAGDVNTSSVYLIGSDIAATIGMGWLATEWHRPAFAPTPNQLGLYPRYEFVPQPINGGINNEAGADISGCIWLSPARPATQGSDALIKKWIHTYAQKLRDNNPMLFLYGDKDARGKAQAEFFFHEVLVANPKPGSPLQPLEQTKCRAIENGKTLSGVALLGNDATLGTETQIVRFLDFIQKDRAKLIRKNRGYTAPWFIQLSGGNGFGFTPPGG